MTDHTFERERRQALEGIQKALMRQLQDLAKNEGGAFDSNKASLPEYLHVQEIFRMNAMALRITAALLETPATRNSAGKDARGSALEDVLGALDALERDFERNYKKLDREQVTYWQKKHPLEEEYLQIAYKENQKHFMKKALEETKAAITAAVPPSPPGLSIRPPVPPSPPSRP